MTTTVLFASRHNPTEEQVSHLKILFGDVSIVTENITWNDPDHLYEVCNNDAYDKVVAVLPVALAVRVVAAINWYQGREDGMMKPCAVQRKLLIPESAPIHAEDGTSRGFHHKGFITALGVTHTNPTN